MGFFDKVRDVLTSSDAERDKAAAGQAPATPAPAEEPSVPAAAASGTPVTPPEGGTTARHRTHTVRRGDSLASIAAEHGVDAEEMARLNGIDNPDLIYPGQVFRVPTP